MATGLPTPYAKADPLPTSEDPVVDAELGREGLTYILALGLEGSVHVEAERRLALSPLSRREIIRRLGTSPAQFYRLLDPTNYRKSIDGVLGLLQVLECDVDLVVRP